MKEDMQLEVSICLSSFIIIFRITIIITITKMQLQWADKAYQQLKVNQLLNLIQLVGLVHKNMLTPQLIVNYPITNNLFWKIEYFGRDAKVCTCCADSIKGQLNRVLSYKYPTSVGTIYKKDFKQKNDDVKVGHFGK